MEEPSVLDYLKEKLNPRHWGKPSEVLPDEGEAREPLQQEPLEPTAEPARARHGLSLAWRVLLALVLAFFAQSLLEPSSYNLTGSLVFYAAALSALMLAVRADELKIVAPAPAEAIKDEHGIRILPLYLFVCVTLLAFHSFINIAITIGILPVTGIPLPFFSYGPSFYLTAMMCVGTLLSVHVRRGYFD